MELHSRPNHTKTTNQSFVRSSLPSVMIQIYNSRSLFGPALGKSYPGGILQIWPHRPGAPHHQAGHRARRRHFFISMWGWIEIYWNGSKSNTLRQTYLSHGTIWDCSGAVSFKRPLKSTLYRPADVQMLLQALPVGRWNDNRVQAAKNGTRCVRNSRLYSSMRTGQMLQARSQRDS